MFKGRSAKKLLREFPKIKKSCFLGSGLWSPTIFCDTIGNNAEIVHEYGVVTELLEIQIEKEKNRKGKKEKIVRV